MNINDLLRDVKRFLAGVPGEDPARLARRVLADVAGIAVADQMANGKNPVPDDHVAAVRVVVDRLIAGEPLGRILGQRAFYGRDFILSPDTLEPRPETELLVDAVLDYMRAHPTARRVLDLGAGTGCIGLTIAAEVPDATVTLTDIADGALATVRVNAERLGLANQVQVIRSNWYQNLGSERFDVIVSNPPYIPSGDIQTLESNVRNHDPILALDGGKDGLDPYRTLFSDLENHLNPHGCAWVEFGIGQRDDLAEIAIKSGLDVVSFISDYAGIPRVLTVAVHPHKK